MVDPPILENSRNMPPVAAPIAVIDDVPHAVLEPPIQPDEFDIFALDESIDDGPPPLLLEAESPEPRPASVETVEVVLVEATPPERRSRRNLQIALRNLVGGLNNDNSVEVVENDSDEVQPVATSSSTRKRRRYDSFFFQTDVELIFYVKIELNLKLIL